MEILPILVYRHDTYHCRYCLSLIDTEERERERENVEKVKDWNLITS